MHATQTGKKVPLLTTPKRKGRRTSFPPSNNNLNTPITPLTNKNSNNNETTTSNTPIPPTIENHASEIINTIVNSIIKPTTIEVINIPNDTSEPSTTESTTSNTQENVPPTSNNQTSPVPLKKRKLDEITPTPPSPLNKPQPPLVIPGGIEFVSPEAQHTPAFSNMEKKPKSWLMEWCQKNKVTPVFSRETVTQSKIQHFVVTLHIPAPYNCTFTSPEPARSIRDAEHTVCQIALHHLDRSSFQQMEGPPPAKVLKASPNTSKLTCADDPFTIQDGLPVNVTQEEPQPTFVQVALTQRALEAPVAFLKEVS